MRLRRGKRELSTPGMVFGAFGTALFGTLIAMLAGDSFHAYDYLVLPLAGLLLGLLGGLSDRANHYAWEFVAVSLAFAALDLTEHLGVALQIAGLLVPCSLVWWGIRARGSPTPPDPADVFD